MTHYCSEHCTGTGCNSGLMNDDPPIKCHVCQESIDHSGRTLPNDVNDVGCYDLTSDFSTACGRGLDYCFTEMSVDWFIGGDQRITFRRGCTATPPANNNKPVCNTGGSTDEFLFKDCKLSCTGEGCNNDKEIELAYTAYDENGDERQIECFEYSSLFDYQGDNSLPIDQEPDVDDQIR